MNKRSIIFFFFYFLLHASFAQEEANPNLDKFFNFGFGYTHPKFLDNSFSSLQYAGHAASVVTGFHLANALHRHALDVRFDYGELKNTTNLAQVEYLRFEGNYAYQKYIGSFWSDKIRWYGGASLNALWNLWIHQSFVNNSYNNSIYTSVSPNTTFQYDFTFFDRNFRAQASVFVPLLTFAIRPFYGASSFSGFLDPERDDIVGQVLESGKVVSLDKFIRYNNTFSLEYFLKNANRLKLSYEWNFLRYTEPRLVKAASHNITFSTMFNF